MKLKATLLLLFIALLFIACPSFAQIRLIGTNFYDFSSPALARSQFNVSGRILESLPASVRVLRDLGMQLTFVPAFDFQTATPSQQLALLAAMRFAFDTNGNPRELTVSAINAMSPSLRQHFAYVAKTSEIYLLHPPTNTVGQTIECLAIPIGRAPASTNLIWDCGTPITPPVTNHFYYLVEPLGIRIRRVR